MRAQHQAGLTLVELLVAVVVAGTTVIAALSLFLGVSRSRDTQEAMAQLQDSGRFLTEALTKSLQQAGYQNLQWTPDPLKQSLLREGRVGGAIDGEPDLRGHNNSATGADLDHGQHDRVSNRVNHSDTLVVRFQGASNAAGADGSMVDCLGRPQAATTVTNDRAHSVFDVRRASATSEPELRCKYKTSAGGFASEVMVRGVEVLQLLYGTDTNGDTVADQWLTAQQVDARHPDPVLAWSAVRVVRVGLVLRSPQRVAVADTTATHQPLGGLFTLAEAADPGATFSVGNDGRLRRVVTFTVSLRNPL